MEIIDKFYEDVKYTNEEIVFMAEHDFDSFSNKFPGLSEYYKELQKSPPSVNVFKAKFLKPSFFL